MPEIFPSIYYLQISEAQIKLQDLEREEELLQRMTVAGENKDWVQLDLLLPQAERTSIPEALLQPVSTRNPFMNT